MSGAVELEGATLVDDLQPGDILTGTVAKSGGRDRDSWIDVNVVRRASESDVVPVLGRLRRPRPAYRGPIEPDGATISVRVKLVRPAQARFEVERLRPANAPLRTRDLPEPTRFALDELRVGDRLDRALVLAVVPGGGVLVDAGVWRIGKRGRRVRVVGMMPRKHFREEWASAGDLFVKDTAERRVGVGDELDLFVRVVNVGNGRLYLSGVAVTEEDVAEERAQFQRERRRTRRRKRSTKLEVGDCRSGTVQNVKEFGAFVDIGAARHGLVHVGRLMDKYKGAWRDKIEAGVSVRVVVASLEGGRIDLELEGTEDELRAKEQELARSPAPSALSRGSPVAADAPSSLPQKKSSPQQRGSAAFTRTSGKRSSPPKDKKSRHSRPADDDAPPLFDIDPDDDDDDEFSEYLDI